MRATVTIAAISLLFLAVSAPAGDTGLVWRIAYDEAGRLSHSVDPAGRVTKYSYTKRPDGALESAVRTPPEGAPVEWRFDAAGRLASMSDGAGAVAYRYNKRGQLAAVARKGEPELRTSYDVAGRLTELRVGGFYRVAWTYDYLGRVEQIDTPAGVVSYEYETGRNRVTRSLPNGIKTFWKRRPNGELVQITHGLFKKPNAAQYSVLAEYTYELGPDGRITAVQDRSARATAVWRYAYDAMGRLVHAAGPGGQEYRYVYDRVGNRLKATCSGRPDQTCSYDWAGRLTDVDGRPCSYDACGNLAEITMDGVARSYRYRTDGRLAEARAGGETVEYRYNGFGRLVARETAAGETRFVPDPLSRCWRPLVMELPDGTRTLIVWDGAAPLALVRDGRVEWLLEDHLGSVRVAVAEDGTVLRSHRYDPFGVPETAAQAGTEGFGFAGLLQNHEAGGLHAFARTYVPRLGAFLQPDPKKRTPSQAPGECALYAYCDGDPLNFVDRDGMLPHHWDAEDQRKLQLAIMSSRAIRQSQTISQRSIAYDPSATHAQPGDLVVRSWQSPFEGVVIPHTFIYWGPQRAGNLAFDSIELQKMSRQANETCLILPAHWTGDPGTRKNFYRPLESDVACKYRGVETTLRDLPLSTKWAILDHGFQYDLSRVGRTHGIYDWQRNQCVDSVFEVYERGFEQSGVTILDNAKREIQFRDLFRGAGLGTNPMSVLGGLGGKLQKVDEPALSRQYASASPVGGVYLGGAGRTLEGIGVLSGVRLDANGSLLLVGEDGGDIKLPPLRLDDVVAVFRAVYLHGTGPTVTIDPNPDGPEQYDMIIRHDDATDGTYAGWILYQADRLMKGYSQGLDNVTQKEIVSRVPGYDEVVDTIYFGAGNPRKRQKQGIWERFWIVPAESRRFPGPRRELTLFDVPLKLKTQRMKWQGRELVDDTEGRSSPGAEAFTKWFTAQYDAIAAEQRLAAPAETGLAGPVPVFQELRRIALLTAIAENLRDQGVPMPFWMRDYALRPVRFERTTPGIEVTRRRKNGNAIQTARIFGGVQLGADRETVNTFATAADTRKAPRAVRRELARSVELADRLEKALAETVRPDTWAPLTVHPVVAHDQAFQAVSVPGAETLALGPCRLEHTDITVPVAAGRELRLVRRFNSFFAPNGPWGTSWTLDLPRLEKIRTPVSGNGETAFAVGYELSSPLNSVHARFRDLRRVPELGGTRLQVPDAASPFLGLADGRLDFLKDPATHVVLLKDGREWHFTEHGHLIAEQAGPQISVYERGADGRVTRMLALFGGAIVARIELEYTDNGLLSKAVGKAIGVPNPAPVELNYTYDSAARLATVRSREGTVRYGYRDSWVASVTRTGGVQGAGPDMQRTFEYNAQGQLTTETQDGAVLRHAVAADPQGGLEESVAAAADGRRRAFARYDRRMRPLESVQADGTRCAWLYRPDGGIETTVTMPDGRKLSVTQSADGRSRTVRPEDGPAVTAQFDEAGRMTALSEDGELVFSQRWRRDGQPAREQTPTQGVTFEYGDDAVLAAVHRHAPAEPGATWRTWQKTSLDRRGAPVQIRDSSGLEVLLQYDPAGRPTTVLQKTPEGNMGYNIERDNAGRVRTVRSSWDNTSYEYGTDGDLQRIETTRAGKSALIEMADGLVRRVTGFGNGVTSFAYHKQPDGAGLLSSVHCANGLELSHTYDAAGRLASVEVGPERRIRLAYDAENRVVAYALVPVSR